MEQNKIKLVVVFVNEKPKGVLTSKQFKNLRIPKWWHTKKEIDVPMEDWNNEKIRIDTIQNYL